MNPKSLFDQESNPLARSLCLTIGNGLPTDHQVAGDSIGRFWRLFSPTSPRMVLKSGNHHTDSLPIFLSFNLINLFLNLFQAPSLVPLPSHLCRSLRNLTGFTSICWFLKVFLLCWTIHCVIPSICHSDMCYDTSFPCMPSILL